MSGNNGAGSADACPVDRSSREAWLEQARAAAGRQQQQPHPPNAYSAAPSPAATTPQSPPPAAAKTSSSSSSSWASGWRIPFFSASPPTASPPTTAQQQQQRQQQSPIAAAAAALGQAREVSTIPRAGAPAAAARPAAAAPAANAEAETGADAATGNWVYPSEQMFFDAMARKGHAARAADMKTVVPIHNAVNERAWREIRAWERPYADAASCPGGPRLHSFTGLSRKMSPKARLNTLLGYTPPFDRHDWVVDRCGTRVEYVIDFYTGRPDAGGRPSFYLDVRPKLNSWEGARMRARRIMGLA